MLKSLIDFFRSIRKTDAHSVVDSAACTLHRVKGPPSCRGIALRRRHLAQRRKKLREINVFVRKIKVQTKHEKSRNFVKRYGRFGGRVHPPLARGGGHFVCDFGINVVFLTFGIFVFENQIDEKNTRIAWNSGNSQTFR